MKLIHTIRLSVLMASFATGILAPVLSVQAQVLSPEEQLGKSIFFDEALSINGNQSCAACHGPEAGWTGPDSAINAFGSVYEGSIPGRFGARKPPSSAYATLSPVFYFDEDEELFIGGNFWDGRATGEKLGNPAADQAQGPFLNPVEQALPDSACVVYRVCTAPDYPVSFAEVWGPDSCAISWPADVETSCALEDGAVALEEAERAKSDMAYDAIALSIAAYEDSEESNPFTSKFDYFLMGMAQLSKQEKRGFNLFKGKGKCARCHTVARNLRNGLSLFTDFTFDNLGLPRNPENPVYDAEGPDWVDPGLGGFLVTRPEWAEYAEDNLGKHKVPTLRNVDKRPDEGFVKAFGHNGYFKDLWQIVHFYNTRDVKPICADPFTPVEEAIAQDCWPEPEIAKNVNDTELGNLHLSRSQEEAIVAFMRSLSDGHTP